MPRDFLRRMWVLLALSAQALPLACHSEQAKRTPAAPLPRFWLAHTTLSDPPISIDQPVLVELAPNGRVRAVTPGAAATQGFLASDVRQKPGRHGGLMLYAQRETELYWRRPDGPLLGHLYPGALVSVAAQGQGRVEIAALPFERGAERVIAFVDRSALGVEPRPLAPLRAKAGFDALRVPGGGVGWRDDPQQHAAEAAWQVLPCQDVWLSADRRTMAQTKEGVELLGSGEDLKAWGYNPVVLYETLTCPARVASGQKIPEGYRQLVLPDSDPLGDAIEQRQTVYWLLATATGPRCDAWQFAPSGKRRSGFLLRAERVSVDGKSSRARLPFDYTPRDGTHPALLHFGTLEMDGKTAMKCECDYRYALLSAEDGELGVTGHPLPDAFSAYDPAELERWFTSADKCQSALGAVVAELARDGTSATRLGFHAQIVAWGL